MAAVPGRHFRLLSPIPQGHTHNRKAFAVPGHPRRNASIRWIRLGSDTGPRLWAWIYIADYDLTARPASTHIIH